MTDKNPWGKLGYPTPEEIERYKNMPVGEFKRFVKSLGRGELKKYCVAVTKRTYTDHTVDVEVSAMNVSAAMMAAQYKQDGIDFEKNGVVTTGVEYQRRTKYRSL